MIFVAALALVPIPFASNPNVEPPGTSAVVPNLSLAISTSMVDRSLDAGIDQALAAAGLTRTTARFDPNLRRMFGGSGFVSPLFLSCEADPWSAPMMLNATRNGLVGAGSSPADTISAASRALGTGTRRSLLGPIEAAAAERAAKPGALSAVLERMKRDRLLRQSIPSLNDVPAPVQQAAALVLDMALQTHPLRQEAIAGLNNPKAEFAEFVRRRSAEPSPMEARLDRERMQRFDRATMMAAAQDMAAAVVAARKLLVGVNERTKYSWSVETRWGRIELSGGQKSEHTGPLLLAIDTGGNDAWIGTPTNQSIDNWLSVTIDTNGRDRYLSHKELATEVPYRWGRRLQVDRSPGPGGALFGLSFLVDTNGNDEYRSATPGLGSARFGVAYLLDEVGDDVYEAQADAQGYALFGVGVLEDLAGDDRYHAVTQAQGMGHIGGFGLVLDRGGNDAYFGVNDPVDYPSPQSKEHNVSMVQGAGYGLRDDYKFGHSLSGGIGALIDLQGNDAYTCAVFGQGVGYWEGIGMLFDDSGDDAYQGAWYVQGASAHFALGFLQDRLGNDAYLATMNMAQGAGHDFGSGMLIDFEGRDAYAAPNLSLGGGNANGIGLFADLAGNDAYSSKGITLGSASPGDPVGSLREFGFAFGLFFDAAGEDAYRGGAWAKNGATDVRWARRNRTPETSQGGAFVDLP